MERITLVELINETHGWESAEWLENTLGNRICGFLKTGINQFVMVECFQ